MANAFEANGIAACDATSRETANGKKVAFVTFYEEHVDVCGEKETTKFEVSVVGRCFDEAASIQKGDRVYVQGTLLAPKTSEGKDGRIYVNTKIAVMAGGSRHYCHRVVPKTDKAPEPES